MCVNDVEATGLRLLHLTAGGWIDITTSDRVTEASVCGTTNSLGTFVLASAVSDDDGEPPSKDKKSARVSNVVSWNVDADGFWDDAANWSGGVVPGDGDTVIIDRPAGSYVITVRTPTANIQSVFATEQVSVISTLTIAATGTFDGGLFLSGTLTGTGSASLSGNSVWQTNGDTIISLAGGVDVLAGRTLTLTAGAYYFAHSLIDSPLQNHGTVVWTGGSLVLNNNTTVTNALGGLWDMQGDLTVASNNNGTASFSNFGTLRKSGGGGTLSLSGGNVAYTNSGTIDLQVGAIGVGTGGLTNSGLLQLAADTTFYLDHVTLLGSSTFGGIGTLHANGTTTLTGDITVTVPLIITGTVTGGGTLHLGAATTWQSNGDTIISLAGGVDVQATRTLTITAGAYYFVHSLIDSPLQNHGTVVWTGGYLILNNNTTVTNALGGLWDMQGDLTVASNNNGTASFSNFGTLRKSGGGGTLSLSGGNVAYTNSGTIDLQVGAIGVGTGGLTNSGLLQLAADTTFYLDHVTLLGSSTFGGIGTLHANGTTTLTGDITVTVPLIITGTVTGGGTLHLGAATTWQSNSDTTISLAGGVDVQATRTLTITAGAYYFAHYLIDSPLQNHGTVVWTGGYLILNNNTAVTNALGGLWDMQGDLTVASNNNGTASFSNFGTLRKSGGGGTLSLSGGNVAYTNSGTIDLQVGAIGVGTGGLTNSGLLQVATNTTFFLDHVTLLGSSTFTGTGTLHANGTTTLTGDVTVTAPLIITGTVTGGGTLHLGAATTWQSNSDTTISLAGGVDVQATRTLTITAGAYYFAHYLIDSPLQNHGTVVWTGGYLILNNNTAVTNALGGLWDMQGDLTVGSNNNGTASFSNFGTLRKSGGGGTLSLSGGNVAYTNSGTIDLQVGAISVGTGGLTNSGLLQLATDTTFYLDHVTLLGSSTFTGTGTLHANGTATVTGDVTLTAVAVLVTGTVTGTGTLHLGTTGTWQANGDTSISLAGGVDVMAGRTLTITAGAYYFAHYLIDAPLQNHGTVVWTGGYLILNNNTVVTNALGGLWDIEGSLTVGTNGAGSPSFVNNGVLLRTGTPNRLTINVPFTNTGTFDVRIGGPGGGQLDEFGGNAVNLGGTLNVHLINGLNPAPTDQFKVIDYASLSGVFATVTGDGFPSADACYNTPNAVFVCNIVTTKITPTITWGDPADIFFGTALSTTQLNAIASTPGTFAYTPAAGTTLNAGNNQLLQVLFTPTDTVHYNTATASAHINVVRATPTITWSNPAPIPYGTALSGTQLNATADTGGTFVYSPAAGTKLHAGNNQLLSVTFTPADTANYENANKSVTINVQSVPLNVTAANAGKFFGAPLPSFSVNYSGFVNGDTPANLGGTLSITTTATPTSPAGQYPITPGGLTSTDYIISFLPGTLTISPANSTTTLYVLPGTTGFLQPDILVAVVAPIAPGAGAPDGNVQFKDGTTVLGSSPIITSGLAYILVNGLAPGAHSLTAAYQGATNFAGSLSAPGSATVRPLANSTFTLLVPTTNPRAAGLPATLVAAVIPLAGGTPTGTVQFSEGSTVIGTANVVGSVATLNTTALGVGTHLLTAKYAGNATFASSASLPAAITIYSGAVPAATATTLAPSPNPSTLGQLVTLTATVTGGATTGSVNFYADGSLLLGTAPIANVGGSFKATLTTSTLPTGLHALSASYMGTAGFAASSSLPAVQTVQATTASMTEDLGPALEQVSKLLRVR